MSYVAKFVVPMLAIFVFLLRRRAVPVIVMRAWFSLVLVWCVILCWLAACALQFSCKTLRLMPRKRAEALLRVVCAAVFSYILRPACPHIRIVTMPGSLPWREMAAPHMCCVTHTSFFDVPLYLWFVPFHIVANVKAFVKSSLAKLPLWGFVIKACAHFPVYFAAENSASFSVVKEKQARVSADVETFLQEGGSLCLFPEGMINLTPAHLRDFRLGSMGIAIKRRLPVYYLVAYGNQELWHPKLKGLPGYPADIYMYLGRYDYDPDVTDPTALATGLRAEMQHHIDDILARRQAVHYVPFYQPPTPITDGANAAH